MRLNDILGEPIRWYRGSTALLVSTVPSDLGPAPATPTVPHGPVVQESVGKRSRMFTYQDLLENEFDAALFEHLATQLAVVDVETAKVTPLGGHGLVLAASTSPDGRFVLVTRLHRPFSYRVPYSNFARTIEVLAADGTVVRVVATLPVADEVPVQGVPEGPRDVEWQPLHAAALLWAEAQDGGDPMRNVPHRDRLMTLAARQLGLERFLIVDVDPHFGDGTRDFFKDDPCVLHINIHSGSGQVYDGKNNNYDIGLGFGATDLQFLEALEGAMELAKDFDFQIAFVIFGHDSHEDDYGGFNLTFKAYPRMAKVIKDFVGDRGLIFVLSGGSCQHVAEQVIPYVVKVLAGKRP